MTTRRGFLKRAAAAGIVFCSCGMLDFANAQNGGRRLPVKVNGKRVRTIDVHAHCLFHESIALMGDQARNVIPPTKGAQEHFIAIETRLKGMDAMAIDMEVLSINPFWYGKDRDTAAKIVELNNEKLAELCAARPDRFAAFASLSLQYPDLALQQLETAIKKQGLKGAAIGGSVLGDDFSNPKYHPVWAKAEELGAVLFIHPQSTPPLAARFKGNGWLSNTIGNPLDTTIALQHLIFEGTLDKFPGLKIVRRTEEDICLPTHRDRITPASSRRKTATPTSSSRRSRPSISTSSISTRWYSPRKRSATSWRKSAQARSCWAPIIRFRGRSIRWTTSSPRRRSATRRKPRSWAAMPRVCSE